MNFEYTAGQYKVWVQTQGRQSDGWHAIEVEWRAALDGGDNSHLRFNRAALTNGGVQIMVEEDTTFDSEMAHTTEPVAFLAIEGDGHYKL